MFPSKLNYIMFYAEVLSPIYVKQVGALFRVFWWFPLNVDVVVPPGKNCSWPLLHLFLQGTFLMIQRILIFTCLLRSYFSLPYNIFLHVLKIPTKITRVPLKLSPLRSSSRRVIKLVSLKPPFLLNLELCPLLPYFSCCTPFFTNTQKMSWPLQLKPTILSLWLTMWRNTSWYVFNYNGWKI